MKINTKTISIVFILILTVVLGIFVSFDKGKLSFIKQFMGFTVTINNHSDFDIIEIKLGIIAGNSNVKTFKEDSEVVHDKQINSGSSTTLKPKLLLEGEGGIYLKFTNSKGETIKKTICSYTESLSGHSDVTVRNDTVNVTENCS